MAIIRLLPAMREVGLHINKLAADMVPGQIWIKRVVAEMGGKDGIVVDETADLEVAALAIVASAFGFQGQKCSSGSRAIVVAYYARRDFRTCSGYGKSE